MHMKSENWRSMKVLCLMIVCGLFAIDQQPSFAADHLSVCLRRAELWRLRDKTLVPGIPSEIWKEVLAAAELAVADPVVTLDTKTGHELGATWNARAAARNMELLSLAYLITEEERFAEWFTVKVKRSQWLDTIECERTEGRLTVSVDIEPALRLPPLGEQGRTRDPR